MCVCALKVKQLELSTLNIVDIQYVAVTQYALTLRSRVKVIRLSNVLPGWVFMLIGLLRFSSSVCSMVIKLLYFFTDSLLCVLFEKFLIINYYTHLTASFLGQPG